MFKTFRSKKARVLLASVGLAMAVLVLGTAREESEAIAATETPKKPLPLALSLLDVMRAAVEIPADGIWAAQSAEKLSDKDWLLADQDSVALAASATLISMGGIGKNDQKWVSNADWQAWTLDVQKTALKIRADAKAKDATKLSADADHLTEICQDCHTKYRPDTPSDGIARYPFYPKRVPEK